jgi:hypothetical protein
VNSFSLKFSLKSIKKDGGLVLQEVVRRGKYSMVFASARGTARSFRSSHDDAPF